LTFLLYVQPHGASATAVSGGLDLIRGISYGPVPLTSVDGVGQMPGDDWFCDEAVPMWGPRGRGDLRIMRDLGANMVRLYGNNPENDHTNFMDEAQSVGLSVAAGMSDWPFFQKAPGNCRDTGYDCFEQVKTLYLQNLQKGFLRADGSYHPALKYMNLINEPDLKMPPAATGGGWLALSQFGRTLISTFDAILEAEKEANVVGPLINLTVTMSFAICSSCPEFPDKPALGQMTAFEDAVYHPDRYGYQPRNDLLAAYRTRFTHSFNTANPAEHLPEIFFDQYVQRFQSTPVYIAEYHSVNVGQAADLNAILNLARATPLFLGISFFEFQVAYWKAGSEMEFGMFGLSPNTLANMVYFEQDYKVHCLVPQKGRADSSNIAEDLAQAYGGVGVNDNDLCQQRVEALPMSQEGFVRAASRNPETELLEDYVRKLVRHLGGMVMPGQEPALRSFVQTQQYSSFDAVAAALRQRPPWLVFGGADARCVANREAAPAVINAAIDWVCSRPSPLSCTTLVLPEPCVNNPYRFADQIFSRFYLSLGASADPLRDCSFEGAALLAHPKVYASFTGATECLFASGVVQPLPTPLQLAPYWEQKASWSTVPSGVTALRGARTNAKKTP